MKRRLGILLALVMLLSFAAAEEAAPALQKNLVILYTGDVHCGIAQGWGYGGLYAVKQALSENNHVLLVDTGDAVQGDQVGTVTRGEAIIDIMNTVGYDLAIPGNHEFDYGMDNFLALIRKADFPYLSCNFNREGNLVLPAWTIREIDGVKIGFVGIVTPDTIRSSTPRYFKDENGRFIYDFMEDKTGEALYGAVQKAVDEVRAEGAAYVIALAHLGNAAEVSPWMYSDVIANTTGIDAMLDGHSHDTEQVVAKNRDGGDVVRSACGTKMENIGALTITPDGQISSELYKWGSGISAPELLGLKNPATEAVDAAAGGMNEKLKQVIAKAQADLVIYDPTAKREDGRPVRIVRNAETNLGDLCADAYLDQAGDADLAFSHGGGIRIQVPAGDVTVGDIMQLHPFGNGLTVIEVTGQQVLDALEWSAHAMPGEFGGFEQVSGITFEVNPGIPSPCVVDENTMFDHVDETMERRVRNVLVAGEPLDPAKTYRLAGMDYHLLNNGDGYTMFDGCTVLQEAVKLDNQVLIDYITETLGGVIGEEYANPYGRGRIVSVGAQ